ncbi:MAG: glycogen synthase GlgA [Clostridia bacterium]
MLFVASEALPYVKTGGLADVMGALPRELNKKGYDARVVVPLYQDIPVTYRQAMEFVGQCYVPLAWRYQYCGIFRQKIQDVTYYFIDNEFYFKRTGLYGHYDDGERFAFFAKAVLEAFKVVDFAPDIIHCNDWHTALLPTFLDTFYRGIDKYKDVKTVFTIHNIEFQGKYGTELISDVLGMPFDKRSLVMMDGCVNYMKAGIESANCVTTVSPTYAQEILTPYFGYGMQNILIQRQYKLRGIVNGIDTIANNPNTDKALFKNFGMLTFGDKVANKLALQELLGLPINANIPMIGMVGRLTHQKGLDLLASVIEQVLSLNIQLVVLGTGDGKYEGLLKEMQKKYSGKLGAIIGFSSDMASKIYGASDMFLMPSKFEPCGLSQLLAMRYGSVPIVRETGGLKDTVTPYNHVTGEGRGFTFCTYDANDMFDAIERAVGLYYDYKLDWAKVVRNDMQADYSWENICKKYIELYSNIK